MEFLDWAALVVGAGLLLSGVRTIRRRVTWLPERCEGDRAVRLGWLWLVMGLLFIAAALLDIPLLKNLFRLFLEAEN
jgi:hypothetical protein